MPRKKKVPQTLDVPAGPIVFRTSEMTAALRPVMIKFIQGLGYTKKKGEAFAEGYLAAVRKLPFLEKFWALERQDGRCMTAGFKAAGISETEALKRSKKK